MITTTSHDENAITSADGLVRIRKTTRPKRWPPHNYPVVIIELLPCKGTRVLALPNGAVAWMPRNGEIRALLLQMGLPAASAMNDKPEERRLKFAKINARRHAAARSK